MRRSSVRSKYPVRPPAHQADADHDILTALERWVENGVSPRSLVAVKRRNDVDPKSEVLRTRRLCPYPLVAKYHRKRQH